MDNDPLAERTANYACIVCLSLSHVPYLEFAESRWDYIAAAPQYYEGHVRFKPGSSSTSR